MEEQCRGCGSASGRHARDSETTELRDGVRSSVQSDSGFVPAGQERKVVSQPGGRNHTGGREVSDFCDSRRRVGNRRERKLVVRAFAECGVAAGRHGGCSGKGDWRRHPVASGVPGNASGVIHCQHHIYCFALLIGYCSWLVGGQVWRLDLAYLGPWCWARGVTRLRRSRKRALGQTRERMKAKAQIAKLPSQMHPWNGLRGGKTARIEWGCIC